MSRFRKASHVLWHCHYHLIWTPKYLYRVLKGKVAAEVKRCILLFCDKRGVVVDTLSIQPDHIHLLVYVPPKVSISSLMGELKGRTAIRIFQKFQNLKKRPYWGNHFWSEGYCVDTVGIGEEQIRKYVQYQEQQEIRFDAKN